MRLAPSRFLTQNACRFGFAIQQDYCRNRRDRMGSLLLLCLRGYSWVCILGGLCLTGDDVLRHASVNNVTSLEADSAVTRGMFQPGMAVRCDVRSSRLILQKTTFSIDSFEP